MSIAASQTPPRETPVLPDVPLLQDALYEIVAAGIDPKQAGVIAKIEAFLHEHARQPKPRDAFIAFYEAHKLALPSSASPWSDGIGSEIRIVPLPAARDPELKPISLDAVREANEDDTNPHMVLLDDDDVKEEPAPAPRSRMATCALWGALAAITAAFAATVWWGHGTFLAMQDQLQAAQAKGAENQQVIRQLENRAQQIEGRAAEIQSSVAASGQMIQKVDQKSDLLIKWINDPKNSPRRRNNGAR